MNENKNRIDLIKEDKGLTILLNGSLIISNAQNYYSEIDKIKLKGVELAVIDFSNVINYDTFIYMLIQKIEQLCDAQSIKTERIGISEEMQKFFTVLDSRQTLDEEILEPELPIISQITTVGIGFIKFINDSILFISFIGELFIKFFVLLIKPKSIRWEDFPFFFMRAGVSAIFIVLLIVFLIGIITGYQGAMQLKEFGADIYIADLVGISITRELSPLMAAIIVGGRSGSAFAAEIGTMKVSEEIDALKSMGFDIIGFIVMPRVLAVMIAMPLLVLLADIAGIVGGLIAAISTLDISIVSYLNQLQKALNYAHIFTGVGKSIIFGFIIASVGCFRGLQVSGGAESVGKYTTASVVMSILLIIIADVLFTFLFQSLGI